MRDFRHDLWRQTPGNNFEDDSLVSLEKNLKGLDLSFEDTSDNIGVFHIMWVDCHKLVNSGDFRIYVS
jgi:hypothetical protein